MLQAHGLTFMTERKRHCCATSACTRWAGPGCLPTPAASRRSPPRPPGLATAGGPRLSPQAPPASGHRRYEPECLLLIGHHSESLITSAPPTIAHTRSASPDPSHAPAPAWWPARSTSPPSVLSRPLTPAAARACMRHNPSAASGPPGNVYLGGTPCSGVKDVRHPYCPSSGAPSAVEPDRPEVRR
jgi:hypothetical protein